MRYIKNIAKCLLLLNYVLCMAPSEPTNTKEQFRAEIKDVCRRSFNGDIDKKIFELTIKDCKLEYQELFKILLINQTVDGNTSEHEIQRITNSCPKILLKYSIGGMIHFWYKIYTNCLSDSDLIKKLKPEHFFFEELSSQPMMPCDRSELRLPFACINFANEGEGNKMIGTYIKRYESEKYTCISKDKMLIILFSMYALLSILLISSKITLACILVVFIGIYCLNMLFLRWNAENILQTLTDIVMERLNIVIEEL